MNHRKNYSGHPKNLNDGKSYSHPEEDESPRFGEYHPEPLTCMYCDQALTPYAEYDILDDEGYHTDCEVFDESVGTTCGVCERFISPFGDTDFYYTSIGVIHDSCWTEHINRREINSLKRKW